MKSTDQKAPDAATDADAPASGPAEVRSLAKGLQILSLFTPSRPVLSVDTIARELGFPKPTTYRFVATLREQGFLRKDPEGGGYALDQSLLRFGEVVRSSSNLERYARPQLEELAAKTRETATLVVRSGERGIVIDKVDSPEMMKFIPEPGWSFPLHAGAAGKVILAWLSQNDLRRYLQRSLAQPTEHTIVSPPDLEAELAQVRAEGYAVADEELMLGSRSIAAPALTPSGEVLACIAIAGPATRLTMERVPHLAPLVSERAKALASDIAGSARA